MNDFKYTVKRTSQFKRDYKLAIKRGFKAGLLKNVVETLAKGEPLPEKNRDHPLAGNWTGYRECHVQADWLLVYRVDDDVLVLTLTRSGTHADIFEE